jgi:hypothetical protein
MIQLPLPPLFQVRIYLPPEGVKIPFCHLHRLVIFPCPALIDRVVEAIQRHGQSVKLTGTRAFDYLEPVDIRLMRPGVWLTVAIRGWNKQ